VEDAIRRVAPAVQRVEAIAPKEPA